MPRLQHPDRRYGRFDKERALAYLRSRAPIVRQGGWLAAGKGVVWRRRSARLKKLSRPCSPAPLAIGAEVVIEAFLEGEERRFRDLRR